MDDVQLKMQIDKAANFYLKATNALIERIELLEKTLKERDATIKILERAVDKNSTISRT